MKDRSLSKVEDILSDELAFEKKVDDTARAVELQSKLYVRQAAELQGLKDRQEILNTTLTRLVLAFVVLTVTLSLYGLALAWALSH